MTNTRPHVAPDGKYSMVEVATILGVNRKTVYRWRQTGYFKTQKHRHNHQPFAYGREILKIYDAYE